MKAPLLFTALILALTVGALLRQARAAEAPPAAYDAKVSYHEKEPLTFPHFILTYRGKREVPPPAGLHAWSAYDFTVTAGGNEQKISWSAGTGDIGPTEFSAGGKKFLLELSRSDTLGRLKEGELVIRRK